MSGVSVRAWSAWPGCIHAQIRVLLSVPASPRVLGRQRFTFPGPGRRVRRSASGRSGARVDGVERRCRAAAVHRALGGAVLLLV